MFTIKNRPPQSPNQPSHRIQSDDIELDFSKNYKENFKYNQYQNLNRAN